MNRKAKQLTICVMTGALILGNSTIATYATPLAGVSSVTASDTVWNHTDATAVTPNAGVSLVVSQCFTASPETVAQEADTTSVVSENEAQVVASEYADIAVAQVDNYVNVRSTPSEDGEVLGKLYNNSAATVLATEGDWYQIKSGNVTGYVKSEFVVVGDEELSRSVGKRLATVNTQTLYVRTDASTESSVLGMVPEG